MTVLSAAGPDQAECIHAPNAEQAARHACMGCADTLELLRQKSTATGALLRNLSEAQLDTATTVLSYPMTIEGFAQNALLVHTE